MNKLNFSGHESFHCRNVWLKKGYDFLDKEHKFNEPTAVVDLGVGKNMVSSINYWMKSFGLVEKNNSLSDLADFLFGKNGADPYLEDNATLWLLHFHLVTDDFASIYSLLFNEFRKKRIEFNKKQFLYFIRRKCEETNTNFNEKTVQRDISVIFRNYVKPKKANKNLEDIFSGIFIDLNLIELLKKFNEEEMDLYKIENKDRPDIPAELILYCILSNLGDNHSIVFDDMLFRYNSVGNVFALSTRGLLEKIQILIYNFSSITFTDDAGIRVLQFKSKPDKFKILSKYYEK
ncbi:MAG: DUF4007 family protein [Bacteroidetes bacterium]|nr:DUF4007 family protein [Bacteroidota bacterium]